MHQIKIAFISCFTVLFLGIAAIQANAQQVVTIQPVKPLPGYKVTITYHPNSPSAKIKEPDSLKLIFSFAPNQFSQPKKFNMRKTSAGWTAHVPLSKHFQYASFYFKAGKQTDKNTEGHQYGLLLMKW